jgi:hypothetical protein
MVMALTTVTAQWEEHIGSEEVTVQQVINRALNAHDLHIALTSVAAAKSGDTISNERLGRWLKKNEGRIVNGMSLQCTGATQGFPRWKLVRGGDGGVWPPHAQ